MLRDVDLKDISDGRFYGPGDMVKVGCRDCEGCSACCHDMEALVLDPYDIRRLTLALGKSFSELLEAELVLKEIDGLLLPVMNMDGPEMACHFLNEAGRCSIHPHRPGICRLFPMGRYYENGDFRYFLQVHECEKPNRYKVRLQKWLDTPDLKRYHAFINQWHDLIRPLGENVELLTGESQKQVREYILRLFYEAAWTAEDFYPQFESRLRLAQQALGPALHL